MKRRLLEYNLVLIGTTMSAAAFGMFILPEGFLAGGVTGSAKLICGFAGVPISLLVLAINLTLLACGFIVLGMAFVSKSVFSSFYFPFALEMTQHITLPLELLPVPVVAVIAGCILGTGAGLVIRGKGSSGGYDILALILNSKFGTSIPVIVNGIDILLILIQIPGSAMPRMLGGLLTTVISTGAMHITLNGFRSSAVKQLHTFKA